MASSANPTSTSSRSYHAVVNVGWALVVPAYALGTFPTAILVCRRAGVDPTIAGSRNPGASNAYRTAGRAAGALVLAGDLAKGAAATGVGWALADRPVAAACGLAAVVGHVLPVQRGFRGGKGVATAAGTAAVLHPLPTAALALVWLSVVATTRRASVASIVFAAGLPIAAFYRNASSWEITALAACAALVILRHRENIARLARGEEHPLDAPGGPPDRVV